MEPIIRRREPASEPIVVIMAIGLDQPIGYHRDPERRRTRGRRGSGPCRPLRRLLPRPASVTRRRWRTATAVYPPPELEIRRIPARPRRIAPVARAVVGLAMLIVATSPGMALPILTWAAVAAAGIGFLHWLRAYVDREIVRQWKFGLALFAPTAAFWLWLWSARG